MSNGLKKATPAIFLWFGYICLTCGILLMIAIPSLGLFLLLLGWFGISFGKHLELIGFGR